MGTSNIYRGPGGSKKLLPEWVDETSLTEKEKDEIIKEWKNVKSNCTRILNSKNKENYKTIFPHYFGAHGGAKNFVKSSKSFKTSFDILYPLLQSINKNGVQQTFKKLGEEFDGKNIEQILVFFSNKYCPNGNDKEEVVARLAINSTLELLIEEIKKHPSIDFLDEFVLNFILTTFVSEYILARILTEIGSSYEKSDASITEVEEFEKLMREYIKDCVNSELKDVNFLKMNPNEINIDAILEKCVSRLGGA